jgi:hypothetical protein
LVFIRDSVVLRRQVVRHTKDGEKEQEKLVICVSRHLSTHATLAGKIHQNQHLVCNGIQAGASQKLIAKFSCKSLKV